MKYAEIKPWYLEKKFDRDFDVTSRGRLAITRLHGTGGLLLEWDMSSSSLICSSTELKLSCALMLASDPD